jgi:hypothetical protein
MSELLDKLSENFPIEDVKQRTQGGMKLDYISIDATIRRLNDVLGADWSFRLTKSDLTQASDGKYLAVVTGRIEALGKVASGVGADTANDPDKALKTALAEALKKAGHQFGIGLYLWDEAERQVIAKQRKNPATAQIASVADQAKAGSDDFGSGSF